MRLLAFLFRRFRTERQLAALAREISDASQSAVWDRVRGQIFTMGTTEARGYVRARAMAPVRQRTAAALSNHQDLSSLTQLRLIHMASDRVVHRILCDLLSGGANARRAA